VFTQAPHTARKGKEKDMRSKHCMRIVALVLPTILGTSAFAREWHIPYDNGCTERENVFAFTQKPVMKLVAKDRYEITFAVKGNCDVTASIIDEGGKTVRHLGAGVLGANAPEPFQKNSLSQKIYWNGKDDLGTYVKEPEKLRARIQLGLKPGFDKRLGGVSPYNLPGNPIAIAVGPDAAYVFSRSRDQAYVRKFDLDGKYVASLVPPPANLPEEKLHGMGWVEYEPGKKVVQASLLFQSIAGRGYYTEGICGKSIWAAKPVVLDKRLYFANAGTTFGTAKTPSLINWVRTDGSTEAPGLEGRPLAKPGSGHLKPRLAVSPDKKWFYMVGLSGGRIRGTDPVALRLAVGGTGHGTVFLGVQGKPGSDNAHFNNPTDVECDAEGRIYVTDNFNKRIQVFSPEGKFLKSIEIDRPRVICVHRKTGAIYVQHLGRMRGRTVNRMTKLSSLENPKEEFHVDGMATDVMVLDSSSPKPRLWIAGDVNTGGANYGSIYTKFRPGVTVWEEDGRTLKKICDFDEEAKKEAAENYMGRWSASIYDHVSCDDVRGHVYYKHWRGTAQVFDLETGDLVRRVRFRGPMNDIDFDKKGYLHAHFDAGFNMPGVARLAPDRAETFKTDLGRIKGVLEYPEVPYDYGIAKSKREEKGHRWIGILPVKDQPGAKFFQDGFGVNMQGEMAVQSNIYYVPKMSEEGWRMADMGREFERRRTGRTGSGGASPEYRYSQFMRYVMEREKEGEVVYSIKRQPGLPISGATVWTYESTGELRGECAVIAPHSMGGTQIDEDGFIYFGQTSTKLVEGKPFLDGRGGNFGTKPRPSPGAGVPGNTRPRTGIYAKVKPGKVRILLKEAKIALDPLPEKRPDITGSRGYGGPAWIEGTEWIYAGMSPLMIISGCSCPSSRPHLDWHKRSFVPETYRHSIGVLDTNGNLIMHIGRYGNFDSGNGAKSRIPIGGDNIAMNLVRFISGTDDYLVFDDWGERLTVVRLNYHEEAVAPISGI
jgi:hypothetical protein